MKKILACSSAWMLCGVAPLAIATTWTEPQPVPDPIRQGATCNVAEPMSSGSYIYHWPSKYDQVFWPLTDPAGVWFCPESGFAAFIGEFELSDKQRAALAADLAATYKPTRQSLSLRAKLQHLQHSYEVRDEGLRARIRVLRVLAYYNDAEFKDHAAATSLRKQALQLIETELQSTTLEPGLRYEYLFVSAAYHRELGDAEKSEAAATELATALRANKEEKLNGYVEYLTALLRDIGRIVPGGPLAPEGP